MPAPPSIAAEQKLAYLSQYSRLDNPYVEGTLHPLRAQQEKLVSDGTSLYPDRISFWITPLCGSLCCWSCGYPINHAPYPCPQTYDPESDIFQVLGVFCWFSCILEYIIREGGHQENNRRQLLFMMARDRYGWRELIQPINKLVFEKYGGPLSHEAYLAKAVEGYVEEGGNDQSMDNPSAALGTAPLPIVRVRQGYPFIPQDLFIEYRTKQIDFLQLQAAHLAPTSSIQAAHFSNGGVPTKPQVPASSSQKKKGGGAAQAKAQPEVPLQLSPHGDPARPNGMEVAPPPTIVDHGEGMISFSGGVRGGSEDRGARQGWGWGNG